MENAHNSLQSPIQNTSKEIKNSCKDMRLLNNYIKENAANMADYLEKINVAIKKRFQANHLYRNKGNDIGFVINEFANSTDEFAMLHTNFMRQLCLEQIQGNGTTKGLLKKLKYFGFPLETRYNNFQSSGLVHLPKQTITLYFQIQPMAIKYNTLESIEKELQKELQKNILKYNLQPIISENESLREDIQTYILSAKDEPKNIWMAKAMILKDGRNKEEQTKATNKAIAEYFESSQKQVKTINDVVAKFTGDLNEQKKLIRDFLNELICEDTSLIHKGINTEQKLSYYGVSVKTQKNVDNSLEKFACFENTWVKIAYLNESGQWKEISNNKIVEEINKIYTISEPARTNLILGDVEKEKQLIKETILWGYEHNQAITASLNKLGYNIERQYTDGLTHIVANVNEMKIPVAHISEMGQWVERPTSDIIKEMHKALNKILEPNLRKEYGETLDTVISQSSHASHMMLNETRRTNVREENRWER